MTQGFLCLKFGNGLRVRLVINNYTQAVTKSD